jgi:hypothetical protein
MASSLSDFLAANHSGPPRYLGSRYDASGQFLSDPGNTVVCHLVQGSPTEKALLAARERIRQLGGDSLALTAPDSLHMTLFQGILDRRRMAPYWPSDVALDTPVSAMTKLFAKRLASFEPGPAFAVEAKAVFPSGVIVDGVSAADRAALAEWRDRLADLFGYRHPDHDSYEFHITFAYPIRWFEPAELEAWRGLLDDVLAAIRRDAPVLELRPPAFCSFKDMNWFEELVRLETEVAA